MSQASTGVPVPWARRRIAVIGGDERDPEIARLAAETGASVHAFGLPWPEEGIPGATLERAASEAAAGADYVLFPIPLGWASSCTRRTRRSRSPRARSSSA